MTTPTATRARPRTGGFTLIELVIALAVIAVLFGAVVYGVGALTGARAKEASAELAGAIRALYDSAALSGRTCRLVFELPSGRDDAQGAVRYRAECAKGAITAASDREGELKRETERAAKREREAARGAPSSDTRLLAMNREGAPSAQELMAREQDRVEEAARYSAFSSEELVARTLPSNVRLEIWTAKQRTPVKEGLAFLYFFPQGYTERAQLVVSQGDNAWTISVSPLTGKTTISAERLEVPRA